MGCTAALLSGRGDLSEEAGRGMTWMGVPPPDVPSFVLETPGQGLKTSAKINLSSLKW